MTQKREDKVIISAERSDDALLLVLKQEALCPKTTKHAALKPGKAKQTDFPSSPELQPRKLLSDFSSPEL